jgi:hypothetical protein
MLLLGISGLWMWARGRTLKQLVLLSVGGVVPALLAVVLVPALS